MEMKRETMRACKDSVEVKNNLLPGFVDLGDDVEQELKMNVLVMVL